MRNNLKLLLHKKSRKTYSFFILTPQSLQVQYPPIGILQELSFLKSLVDHLSHQLLLYQQL